MIKPGIKPFSSNHYATIAINMFLIHQKSNERKLKPYNQQHIIYTKYIVLLNSYMPSLKKSKTIQLFSAKIIYKYEEPSTSLNKYDYEIILVFKGRLTSLLLSIMVLQ